MEAILGKKELINKVTMKKTTFTGAGINGSSFMAAIVASVKARPKQSSPAASWPFVNLSVDKNLVKFNMITIHKSVTSSETRVTLSKTGYLYFLTPNHANDFGFATPKIDELLTALRDNGFQLDASCVQNLRVAKLVMLSTLLLGLLALSVGGLAVILSV